LRRLEQEGQLPENSRTSKMIFIFLPTKALCNE
jgi:hypothetical protein